MIIYNIIYNITILYDLIKSRPKNYCPKLINNLINVYFRIIMETCDT